MTTLPPIPETFTNLLLMRDFEVLRLDGTTSALQIEIGTPIQDVETASGTDWRCPLRITDDAGTTQSNTCGIDAWQAVELSLKIVQHHLEQVRSTPGTTLLFLGEPYDPAICGQ